MIHCDACGAFFHAQCLGYSDDEAAAIAEGQEAREQARAILREARAKAIEAAEAGRVKESQAIARKGMAKADEVLLRAPATPFIPSHGTRIPDPRDVEEKTEAELAIEAATLAQYSGRGRPRSARTDRGPSLADELAQVPTLDPVSVSHMALSDSASGYGHASNAAGGSRSAKASFTAQSGSSGSSTAVAMEDDSDVAEAGDSASGSHSGRNGVQLHPPPLQPSAPYPFLRLGGAALLPYSKFAFGSGQLPGPESSNGTESDSADGALRARCAPFLCPGCRARWTLKTVVDRGVVALRALVEAHLLDASRASAAEVASLRRQVQWRDAVLTWVASFARRQKAAKAAKAELEKGASGDGDGSGAGAGAGEDTAGLPRAATGETPGDSEPDQQSGESASGGGASSASSSSAGVDSGPG